jgi:hypothetical protein
VDLRNVTLEDKDLSTTPKSHLPKGWGESRVALSKRLQVYGLKPAEASEILREIEKWVRNTGREETVKRLKTLKQYRLNTYLGRSDSSYVRRHRDGTPKGPFRVLWRLSSRVSFLKAWNCLMVYSHFTEAKITSRQWIKFEKGVRRDAVSASSAARAETYIDLGIESWLKNGVVIPPPPGVLGGNLEDLSPSQSRNYPTGQFRSKSQPDGLYDSAEWFVCQDDAQFVEEHSEIFEGVFWRMIEGEPFDAYIRQLVEWHEEPSEGYGDPVSVAGRLALVQEAGCKGRFIANPSSALQAAALPLYKWSNLLVNRLPGNYSLDQEEGVYRAQQLLNSNGIAFSIDLEGATDNLPRSLVLHTMRRLGIPEAWCTFYEDVCKLPWFIPREFEKVTSSRTISWTVGQPLGWYPVFNLALCITLGALVEGVCSHASADKEYKAGSDNVRCGDDLVIFQNEAGMLCMDLLSDLGVPVSVGKTLISDKACEFCSRLITTDGVVPGYKWKSITDDNFLDFIQRIGKRGVSLLTRQQRVALRWLAPVPEPWGLGWNAHGIPAVDRFDSFVGQSTDALSRGGQLVNAGLSRLALISRGESALASTMYSFIDDTSEQDVLDLISVTFGPGRDARIYGPWLAGIVTQVGDLVHANEKMSRLTINGAAVTIYSAIVDRMRSLLPPFIVDDLKPAIDEYGEGAALWNWYESAYRLFKNQSGNPYKEKLTKLSLVDMKVRVLVGACRRR